MIDDVEMRARYEVAVDSLISLSEKLATDIAEGQVLTPMAVSLAVLVLEQKRTVESLRRAHVHAVAG